MSDIALKQMLKAVSSLLPSTAEPTNPVSRFVQEEIVKLFGDDETVDMLRIIAVDTANKDPTKVLEILQKFNADLVEFGNTMRELPDPRTEEPTETPFVVQCK